MADYLETARRTLAAMAGLADPDAQSEPPGTAVPTKHGVETKSPPAAEWPKSLREPVERKSGASGDSEAAGRKFG
jgi:hypothetical protein